MMALLLHGALAAAQPLQAECANGISIEADIDPQVRDFHFWENLQLFSKLPHVSATLTISTRSEAPAHFSTRMAVLSAVETPAGRAYLDSIADQPIDFATVEVLRGSPVQIKVYWPVPRELGTILETPDLQCVPIP